MAFRRLLRRAIFCAAPCGGWLAWSVSPTVHCDGPVRVHSGRNIKKAQGHAAHRNVFDAVRANDVAAIGKMETSEVNTTDFSGHTPLSLAASLGRLSIVKLLLERGANANAVCGGRALPGGDDAKRWDVEAPVGLRAAEVAIMSGVAKDVVVELVACTEIPPPRKRGDPPYEEALTFVSQHRRDIEESMRAAVEEGLTQRAERLRKERKENSLEKKLTDALVGQRSAIGAVSRAIRRRQGGWDDLDGPLVMLFMGSSGIGKTETAKTIASYIHPNRADDCFIRIDMSEYQHEHEVSKFVGAPPGYVGYDQGGQLTKRLSKCPNAVILLDEVEKAHPDVMTIMLQTFDEGRLTDGHGKTVDCRDATFIMTSNLGQREIASEALRIRGEYSEQLHRSKVKDTNEEGPVTTDVPDSCNVALDRGAWLSQDFISRTIHNILRAHFGRDELIGRIQDIVFFLPFTHSEQQQLVERALQRWKQRAFDQHRISLTFDNGVVDGVCRGYDVRYGARSIQHEVRRAVVNVLAEAYDDGAIRRGDTVRVSWSLRGEASFSVDERGKGVWGWLRK